MNVLVVSEGKHEQAGALENLLRRLGADEATFTHDRVCNDTIHAVHGKGRGYFKRAVRWLLEAKRRGFDALVLLVDQDGERERSKQISEAQDSEEFSQLPRAMGVAIRTFDAWMLADEMALTDVLRCPVNRQAEPETIRDPKEVCASLRTNGRNQMAQSEMYAKIAQRVDITVLVSRCPSGFRPFAERVRRVFVTGARVEE
jgi:hypothetical protein